MCCICTWTVSKGVGSTGAIGGAALLNILSTPDVATLDRREDGKLVRDDGFHHDVVEDGSDDGSEHLGAESGAGR